MIYGRGTSELSVNPNDMVVATKIPGEFLSYDDVFKAKRRGLERLGLPKIDVMQIH